MADIQVRESRNQLTQALQTNADLSKEIGDVRCDFEHKLEVKEQEIKKLKELLHESLEREKKLMLLNAEAYNLIKLQSIHNL
ncbi:hypothetical protein EON65_16985 [archaeon]|nr:MAG: hypothetical protein EON65_16985 [archaeon]